MHRNRTAPTTLSASRTRTPPYLPCTQYLSSGREHSTAPHRTTPGTTPHHTHAHALAHTLSRQLCRFFHPLIFLPFTPTPPPLPFFFAYVLASRSSSPSESSRAVPLLPSFRTPHPPAAAAPVSPGPRLSAFRPSCPLLFPLSQGPKRRHSPNMAGRMVLYKLVVLGDGGVGKTALTIQLCLQHFVETVSTSVPTLLSRHSLPSPPRLGSLRPCPPPLSSPPLLPLHARNKIANAGPKHLHNGARANRFCLRI